MRKEYQCCPCCDSGRIGFILSSKDHTVSNENFEVWQCFDCNIRFTQSIPVAEDIGLYYQSENYISHSNTNKGFINSLYHRVRKRTLHSKEKLIKKTTGLSKGNILDVGAGTGAFLKTMESAGWNITGIEPDEIARTNAKEFYNLSLKPAEKFYALPEQSFDAITLWHVLEHVHELHSYINQLKKLLKPNGVLFVAVPNYTCYDEKVYKEYWAAYDVPRHLYHFSPLSIKKLFAGHQLTVTQVRPMWFDSFYVSMLSEKYKTGMNNYVIAFLNGFISNLKTVFNKVKCSSQIYIIKNSPIQPL